MLRKAEVGLSTNATVEELEARFMELIPALDAADAHMHDVGQRWQSALQNATDPADADRQWSDYLVAAREYRVLCAWKDVVYAAYIFATDGPDCIGIDGYTAVSRPRRRRRSQQ